MSMKLIHRFKPGIPILSRQLCGADGLFSGIFGLASTESTNSTNEDISARQLAYQRQENQINRDYNTRQAEIARSFVTGEREAQQQYQRQMVVDTPSLQAEGMRKAGINPVVAFGNGTQVATGGSSAPSGAQGPVASSNMGLSPVPYQAINPASSFAQIAQGLSSLATAKEKGANVGLIEKHIENMAVDTQMKQVLMDGYKISNNLQKLDLKYREKKLLKDLQEQVIRMATTQEQGKLFTAQAKIQAGIDRLNQSLADYHGQQSELIKLEVANYSVKLKAFLNLNAAQVKEANTKAFEAGESAKTISGLRKWQVDFEQAKSELAKADSFVARNTYWERLNAKVAELKAQEMLPQQVEQAIINAKKNNDWYELNELMGIVDVGVRAAGTYYGAKTGKGFVDAQNVSNSIQKEYNDWRMSQPPHRGTYEQRQGWSMSPWSK